MSWAARLASRLSPARRRARRLEDERRARNFEVIRAGGWPCHACDEARPDHMIDVLTVWVRYPSGLGVQHNKRYCVDRPACLAEVTAQLERTVREAAEEKENM